MTSPTTFVTGIHRGLGNGLAQVLLEQGARVYGVSRQCPENLARHPNLCFRPLDLTRLEEIHTQIRALLQETNTLDLVILNAGILGEIKPLRDTSLHEIERIMTVNVWANKLIFDTLLDMEIPIQQVVAMSSGAAFNGSGGWGAYSMSKSALNLLFRVYAHEHEATHFTSLAPGLIASQMLDYVCSLPADERFPAVSRIQDAQGTDRMQSPTQAAERIIDSLPRLLETPSGAFVDIREL
jgi:NAD(P)-dependent dehydrogenase (short-subunit alcohol dehydrogenase family)